MTGTNTRRASTPSSRATIFAVFAVLAVIGSAVCPGIARAQVSLDVVIRTPPPPMPVVVVPAPRAGFVWAPGYWSWDGHRHAWHDGHWEAERPDERYVAARWANTPEGWRFFPAHWEHFQRERAEHEHEHEHEHDDFCPPGQAKKGRC